MNEILVLFGDIQNVNYIEYVFQIIQLIMTIITFLTVFMSVHYQENIVKLQRAKMEIRLEEDMLKVKRLLYDYIYMQNYAIKHYKSTLKIFNFFSFAILYISMICAFIYSAYLSIMAILLIWSTEMVFLLAVYFISRKLYGKIEETDIDSFFNYNKIDNLYNNDLKIKPTIKITLPKSESKYIVEIILPYYFYDFECVVMMSNVKNCIEILAKGEAKREITGQDILNDYIISNTFDQEFKYINQEICIFTKNEKGWSTYKANICKREEEYCTTIEIVAEKLIQYKQLSPIAISNINKIQSNTIEIVN